MARNRPRADNPCSRKTRGVRPARSRRCRMRTIHARRREDGQTMAEYAVVLAVITPAIVAAFVIEHSLSIRKQRLMPEHVMLELEDRIARGDVDGAVHFCREPHNYSLASDVVLAGLERY